MQFKSPEAKKSSDYFSHSKKDPLLFLQRQKTLDVEKPSAVVVIIENVQAFSIVNFHIFYAVSAIVNVFPCGMGLKDVIVKLPVSKYSVTGRATKILCLHMLFLEVSSHVVATLYNFPTH